MEEPQACRRECGAGDILLLLNGRRPVQRFSLALAAVSATYGYAEVVGKELIELMPAMRVIPMSCIALSWMRPPSENIHEHEEVLDLLDAPHDKSG